MKHKSELPSDEEVRLVHNDKGDEELSAWDPDSGETERTFNETDNNTSDICDALRDVARWAHSSIDLIPDYGKLYYNAESAAAWWVGGDGDDRDASNEIERKLSNVPGVLGVTYESEGFPPRNDPDWRQLWPVEGRDKSMASESIVGTGAIAFAPSVAPISKVRKAPKRRKHQTESHMADPRRRRIAEESGSWFKEGPVRGDHQMDSPTGEGVAKKTATRETMNSSQDTKFKQSGDEWPRKHKGNLAMGTPEDGGQGGDHRSEAGDPDDGYQTETGHDWPDDPKNSGQGVAEPFDRTLEGTEMPKGTPPKGFGAGAPASDSSANEGWSLNRITAMMETDSLSGHELQRLFDAYARETDYVCLENFYALCRAHGAQNVLDEGTLLSLMDTNRDFVFHEMVDASGPYWIPRQPISEGDLPPALEKHKFKKGSDADGDGETNERSHKPWEDGDEDNEDDDDEKKEKPWESRNRGSSISEGKRGGSPQSVKEKDKRKGPSRTGALFQGKAKSGGKRKQKPDFLKSESTDPNARCRDWLGTVAEIRNLLHEGHVTATAARSALQASFNVQLSRQHLLGCSRSVLESVRKVVDHYGLGVDKRYQNAKRLWEARYGVGGQSDGLDDPFDGASLPGSPTPGVRLRRDEMSQGLMAGEEDDYNPREPGDGGDPYDELPEGDFEGGEYGGDMDRFADPNSISPDDGFDEFDPAGGALGDPGADGIDAGDLPDIDGQDPYGDDPGLDPSPRGGRYGDMRGIQGARMPGRARPQPVAPGGWQEGRGRSRRPINEDEDWFREGAPRTVGGHKMDQSGNPVGGSLGGGHDSGLYPDEDAEMEEVAGKDLLGLDQENNGEGQVEFEHGGEGTMRDGHGPKGTAPEPKAGIKENLRRISGHVRKRLQECSSRVPAGKYALKFSAVVAGSNKKIHNAPTRNHLAEAIADAEELLLIYGKQRVMLEAAFLKGGTREIYRERIALPSVKPRGPFVTEGRACFRFPKHAEQFANELLREGKDCRVTPHNWGTAVEAKISGKQARLAFAAITK